MTEERQRQLSGYGIVLTRSVNENVVEELKTSLTRQEWASLIKILARALEDDEFYAALRNDPRNVLKSEGELSDYAIEGLARNFDRDEQRDEEEVVIGSTTVPIPPIV